jgi:aspartyl aminopeptidase
VTIKLVEQVRKQLDASPTPRHLVEFISAQLAAAGFFDCTDMNSVEKFLSSGFIKRSGSLVAWRHGSKKDEQFRIIGAHTDSPCLKIKPRPDESKFGWHTLQVEIYGSPLLNSWLDRDLGIAGHAVLRDGSVKLFCSPTPIARISQLAIHLDREVNERGLILDKQLHLSAAWATGEKSLDFVPWVASQVDSKPNDIISVDAQFFDSVPAQILGVDQSLLASGRLDNQASCWAAISALIETQSPQETCVIALFDHEEVGSSSATGAAGPLLEHTLERIASASGLSRVDYLQALSRSSCISADNAHAVHHNYPDRHDHAHAPIVNQGPALKLNSNQRYATSSTSAAMFIRACESANVKHQVFVSKNNMPCGTTIGPITATRLGIDTVDVGIPQLSMHSAREVCGVSDLVAMQKALRSYINS